MQNCHSTDGAEILSFTSVGFQISCEISWLETGKCQVRYFS